MITRSYAPGPEADAIVDRLLAMGHFSSTDEVVRAGLELLRKHDLEVDELLRLGEARIAEGQLHPVADRDEMVADGAAPGKANSA